MSESVHAEAKLAIAETMSNYATGLDSKNWALVRDCFCDEVLIDYGEISQSTGGPDKPRQADDWVKVLQGNLQGFDITHHMIGNHRYQRRDDRVECISYLVAEHIIFEDPATLVATEGSYITVAGYYTNGYLESRSGWRIADSQLKVTWMRGDPGLFARAAERGVAG